MRRKSEEHAPVYRVQQAISTGGRRSKTRKSLGMMPTPLLCRDAAYGRSYAAGCPLRQLRPRWFRGKTIRKRLVGSNAMTYRAPINDILLSLNHGAGLARRRRGRPLRRFRWRHCRRPCWRKPASSPPTCWRRSNKVGDEHGIKLDDGNVTTAPGWPDAYKRWTEGGWNAVSGRKAFGGQGLPIAINAACTEIWSASNVAFGSLPAARRRRRSRRWMRMAATS